MSDHGEEKARVPPKVLDLMQALRESLKQPARPALPAPKLPDVVCDCWDKAPTVPTCRGPNTHLDDCPAKDSGFPVGVNWQRELTRRFGAALPAEHAPPDAGLVVQEKFDVAARCDSLATQFEDGKSPLHKLTMAGLLRSAARLLRVRGSRPALAGRGPSPEFTAGQLHEWLREWGVNNDEVDEQLFTEEQWAQQLTAWLWAKIVAVRAGGSGVQETTPP